MTSLEHTVGIVLFEVFIENSAFWKHFQIDGRLKVDQFNVLSYILVGR